MQGLSTKVNQLKEYFEKFDIIMLIETFVEAKNTSQMEERLPGGYEWRWTPANRDLARGRPWGGALIGVKEDIGIVGHWGEEKLGSSAVEVKIGEEEYYFMNLYNRKGIETIKQKVIRHMERNGTKKCLILGDWNAKIGRMGKRKEAFEWKEAMERNTMDDTVNEEGRRMMELLNELGLSVLNGNKEGDWSGAITHIGYRSQAVLDYGCVNEQAWEDVEEFHVGNCSLSDHFPLELSMTTTDARDVCENQGRTVIMLNESNGEKYQEELSTAAAGASEWGHIAECMRRVVPKTVIRKERRDPHWWNEECYRARLEVQRQRHTARRSNDFTAFREARRAYKTCIRTAKQEFSDRQVAELQNVTSINQAWKYLAKCRQKGRAGKQPRKADLVEHFMSLLDANTDASLQRQQVIERQPIPIEANEFELQLNRMKNKKATGVDQVSAEMIKYADPGTKEKIRMIMEKCLGGATIPSEWKEARIHPIHKKGDTGVAENYRGIAIVNGIYKLYAQIICARLNTYCEEHDLLPDCQNGFRKQRSTIDAIYVLNHCVQTTLARGKQLYAAFVDYKAAFDTVNRDKLFSRMEKMGIPQYLVEAIRGIYRETIYYIEGTRFLTSKGLRQGCPLSPLLFALYTSDMESVLRKWQSGGVVVKRKKIFMLAYADDVAIVAHSPEELKDMLKCLLRYSSARDLVISTGKSKVMRFSRGGAKSKQKWVCGTETLEEVNRFLYLGFMFQGNGSHNAHVKEMSSRAASQVSRVWSLAERKFPENFMVRMQMFTSLVEPTALYGCEIFGFQVYEELERIQRKYIRWTLGLPPWSRNDLIMKEARRYPVSLITATRAAQYEERILNGRCEIAKECLEESLEEGCGASRARSRTAYWNHMGFSASWIAQRKQEGATISGILRDRHQEQIMQGIAGQMGEGEEVGKLPRYLEIGREMKLVARFRLGCEELANQRWGDRRCRVCRQEEENLDHILICSGSRMSRTELLHIDGRGRMEMKRIRNWRGQ